MPARRKRVKDLPRDAIGSAVRIVVGELPNDTLPEDRMQASLLMEAQSIINDREAELKETLELEAAVSKGDTL